MASVRELIGSAYELSGTTGLGEAIEGLELDRGLVRLNSIVDQWKNEELMCYTDTRLEVALSLSNTSFTIGDFNTFKALRVVSDGFTTNITTKDNADILSSKEISFYDFEGYATDK